jgi:hypothetical protein
MSDSITPADETVLQRRGFLRSGALLAAAAGGAVVASAAVATPASAADGDAIAAGGSYTSTTTTTLALDPGLDSAATLTLTNSKGPALLLTESSTLPDVLPVGAVASYPGGLLVGVQDGSGTATAEVVTSSDLQGLPVTFPLGPSRVLNTQDDATLDAIVASSSGAFDSHHRLKKGAWIDVAVLPTNVAPFEVGAAHITLTALDSTSAGSLVACPPGDKPSKVATLPFSKNRLVATGTYVATGVVASSFAVRIYATATTHVKVDVTGLTVFADFGLFASRTASVGKVMRSAQEKVAKHVQQVGARARLS